MLSLGPWIAALYGLLLLINRFALIDDPGSMYDTRSYDPKTFVNPYRLDTGVWLTVAAALLLFLGMYLPQLNLTQLSGKNIGIGLGLSMPNFAFRPQWPSPYQSPPPTLRRCRVSFLTRPL
ncbi:MAG: hypothetical protein KJ063_14310 [Anaerolineae bacterium]|nr:hypothetical protein [Anaerolineae bacterium]